MRQDRIYLQGQPERARETRYLLEARLGDEPEYPPARSVISEPNGNVNGKKIGRGSVNQQVASRAEKPGSKHTVLALFNAEPSSWASIGTGNATQLRTIAAFCAFSIYLSLSNPKKFVPMFHDFIEHFPIGLPISIETVFAPFLIFRSANISDPISR